MDHKAVLQHALKKPGAAEDYPFGDDVCTVKVGGKIFAIVTVDRRPGQVSLKCDPDWALELREIHSAITPGYHLNKRHWNTVTLDGSVPGEEVRDMIDHSYDLVVRSLPKRIRP